MRKNFLNKLDLPSNGVSATLIIVAIIFLVGGIAGCTLAGQAEGRGEAALNDYLDGFLNVALSGEMVKPAFVPLLWKAIRWPLFAFFLGLTPVGLIGIPLLFLARAFLLSFSISSFFHVFGAKGLFFAFSVFGITNLVYIPILFILGIQSFLNAGSIIGRITGENRRSTGMKRSDFLFCCICFLILFLCCFFDFTMGETLLNAAAELMK